MYDIDRYTHNIYIYIICISQILRFMSVISGGFNVFACILSKCRPFLSIPLSDIKTAHEMIWLGS